MSLFHKEILVTAVAAALGLGVMGNAHAGAKAFSSLDIDNFQMFNATTGVQMDVANFVSFTANDTVNVSSVLDGTSDGPNVAVRTATESDLTLGAADPAMACVGADCAGIGENDFTQQDLGLPAITGHFSRADGLLQGAIISGTDVVADANAQQVAEVQLNQTGDGEALSSITNASEFVFDIEQETDLRFDFDATSVLHVLLHQDEIDADAGRSFSLTIAQDGIEIFNWTPTLTGAVAILGGTQTAGAFNLNTGLNIQSAGEFGPIVQSGFFSATTGLLTAGTYNLTIGSTAFANAAVIDVPEPATLALFGAGLLGIGGVCRRRNAKA